MPWGQSESLPSIETRRRRVEFYRMTQVYKDYRYFEVDTRVELEEPPTSQG